jgi:predicted small secreted protein
MRKLDRYRRAELRRRSMRKSLILTLACAGLAIAACSKNDQQKAGEDAKAAAAKVGDAAKDVAHSDEVKAVGSDIKAAAGDAAAVTAEAAKDAAAKTGAAAKDVAADVKQNTAEATANMDARLDAAATKAKADAAAAKARADAKLSEKK